MDLVEKHFFGKEHIFFNELDALALKSKNLYNSCLYIWRDFFFRKEKITNAEIYKRVKNTDEFKALPQNVSAQVFMQFLSVINLFFHNIKNEKNKKNFFWHKIKVPKYKDSKTGRNLLVFNERVLPKKKFKKDGKIRLTGTYSIEIKTNVCPKYVKIIPRYGGYVVDVIYNKDEDKKILSENYAGLDLGVNNLGVLSFNNSRAFIINGRPLKSINQFYSKNKSNGLKKKKEKYRKLSKKRKNKITDYLHKSSRFIVNQLVSKNVSTIVIGNNKNWKQDIKLGRNGDNFKYIPHAEFVRMIKYKCELKGISVILAEESYTSKCSFIDSEKICKHSKYLGKREKRGLFVSSEGKKINADLNGSLNILRKVVPNCFTNGIEGLVISPTVYTVKL